jgi:hypothetical protein
MQLAPFPSEIRLTAPIPFTAAQLNVFIFEMMLQSGRDTHPGVQIFFFLNKLQPL